MRRKIGTGLMLTAGLLLLLPPPARAYDHRERDHWHGDLRYFHEHDWGLWRTGHWYHGAHLGRAGWWWTVNGIWYWYPRRISVIPDPYIPPTVTVQVGTPPPIVMQAPPPMYPPQNTAGGPPPNMAGGPPPNTVNAPPANTAGAGAPPPPPAQNWYYCNNPHGYYPYVASCQGGWTTVPATQPEPVAQ